MERLKATTTREVKKEEEGDEPEVIFDGEREHQTIKALHKQQQTQRFRAPEDLIKKVFF